MSGVFAKLRNYMDERGTTVRRFIGLAVSVLTVLVLIGCVSYLFTWKQDQSLLVASEALDSVAEASNMGGKLGSRLSALLVGKWFGLGAFAIVFAMVVLSVRLVFGKRKFAVVKTIILSITGAELMSFFLAFFSLRLGMENTLGGGLGGECGSVAVKWCESMMGVIITFFVLCVLLIVWLFFSSRKFSEWFSAESSATETVGDTGMENKIDIDIPMEKKKKRTFTFLGKDNSDVKKIEIDEQPVVSETPLEKPMPAQEVLRPEIPAARSIADTVKETSKDAPVGPAKDDEVKIIEGTELTTDVDKELPRIDVRGELENYDFPGLDLLSDYTESIHNVPQQEIKRNNYKIRATLQTYKIGVDNVEAVVGPTVTLYKVYPSQGVKIASIQNLHREIAMALNANGVRMVMLPDSVGIEVPNDMPSTVPLKALLNSDAFRESKAELPIAMGYTITQKVKVFDLADAPHLLVAGATKQGKSVGLNVLIASLLYSKHPSELKLVFIDPKMVEFSAYNQLLHHYLAVLPNAASEEEEMANAIVKKAPQAEAILRSLCIEMDERYELLSKALVSNIKLYNDKYRDRHLLPTDGHRFLPYIVTIIDEYADLTMSTGAGSEGKNVARSITNSIIRLAQKGRAAGIHIVLATQRPSVDIITGAIKTNFPTRIAFRVISRVDSQTILDSPGAEKLIGRGDMLYYAGVEMERVQCAFISNSEIIALTKHIGGQKGYKKSYNTPYYLPAPDENKAEDGTAMLDARDMDERFEEAARMVVTSQRGSTSDLQRRLGMGYAKAGRVMDQLESAGIVGPQEGSKPRQVLISDMDELDALLKSIKQQ